MNLIFKIPKTLLNKTDCENKMLVSRTKGKRGGIVSRDSDERFESGAYERMHNSDPVSHDEDQTKNSLQSYRKDTHEHDIEDPLLNQSDNFPPPRPTGIFSFGRSGHVPGIGGRKDRPFFDPLSDKTVKSVLEFCDGKTLARMLCVSRRIKKLAQDDRLWEAPYKRVF